MTLSEREQIVNEIRSLIVALNASGGWSDRANSEGWFNHEILEDALALIEELTDENEMLRNIIAKFVNKLLEVGNNV